MRMLTAIVATMSVVFTGSMALAQDISGKWYGILDNYSLSDPRRVLAIFEKAGTITCTWDEVDISVDAPAKCRVIGGVVDLVTAANNTAHLALSGNVLVGTLTFTGGRGSFQISMNRTPHETVAAPVYSWTSATNLVGGIYRNCGDPPFQNRKIVIRGDAFTATPDHEDQWNRVTTLNLKSLNSDGSGRISVKNRLGVTRHFDFDPGQGPRVIRVGGDNAECRYIWKPF
jgi:hypothetical protein